ncbi:MAG: glutamate racemase [Fermentimonas sp.]|nr:glutamate racemase [Fermentimonas sp.]
MEDNDTYRAGAIGVFDSGYGGLTVLSEIKSQLPEYDFIYLGDNARTPYGNRSYERVYEFTLEAVKWFFKQGCKLVILACNTASAKALRSIQQIDLPQINSINRVLGVIRPTAENVSKFSQSGHIGIMGTEGTIQSKSYDIEINKLHPNMFVTGEACPMWVPLVENREYNKPGADYFIKKHIDNLLSKDPLIDTIILACTHYPLLIEKINNFLPKGVRAISQGKIIAESLKSYLKRHPEMDILCSKKGTITYFTTDSTSKFIEQASIFLDEEIVAHNADL